MYKINVNFVTEGTINELVNPINNTYLLVLVKLLVLQINDLEPSVNYISSHLV